MTPTTRFHVYMVERRDPEQLLKLDEVYAATPYEAVRETVEFRAEDGWPLKACNLVAIADWAMHKSHHPGSATVSAA